jgi:CRISPR-associated protein Cas6
MTISHVDLAFPAHGQTLPRDHGYALYGALSRAVPDVHGADWIGIHGIAGRKATTADLLDLTSVGMLKVRAPTDRISQLLALTGAEIHIAGHAVRLGPPSVHAIQPVSSLDARLVVIRLTGGVGTPFNPEIFDQRFEAEAKRQLERIGVRAELALRGRRSVSVAGQRIIGHSVRVIGLSAEHSVLLQVHGIGGKRTMGCGIFRPTRMKVGPGVTS